jgi:ribose 1,5-bisphosphate isomerase
MSEFEKICKEIKSLKVQGAEQVARAALKSLEIKHDSASIKKLVGLRPTEPCLRNCIYHALSFHNLEVGIQETLKVMNYSRHKVITYGSNLIKNKSIVFTHCHSGTVISILLEAKRQGKKFQVYNTETRPNLQGRITAQELLKAGIPVTMFVDSSSTSALNKADLFLFGVDAITSQGSVINKIGNKMMAEIAQKYDVPSYACSFSWKFDPKTMLGKIEKLESRDEKEVWPGKPKKLKISNVVFEEIPSHLITGIVSELGVLEPGAFVSEFSIKYPFLFK